VSGTLADRPRALRRLEAITLIHRHVGLSLLGIRFGGFIDIDDSEAAIRAMEITDNDIPIDLVLHTPGGLALAAEQIASALADHPAPVTAYIPHYAMSGGTLIALSADRIVMAPSAVLGPVDPQLGDLPATSILAAIEHKDPDETDDRSRYIEEGRQPVHLVKLTGEAGSQVEAEPVDVHVGHPVPQRVHDQLQHVGMAHVQRVAPSLSCRSSAGRRLPGGSRRRCRGPSSTGPARGGCRLPSAEFRRPRSTSTWSWTNWCTASAPPR
jgi:hypothetical protein